MLRPTSMGSSGCCLTRRTRQSAAKPKSGAGSRKKRSGACARRPRISVSSTCGRSQAWTSPLTWENAFAVDPRASGVHADTPADGLLLSLQNLGRVDIEHISQITGIPLPTCIVFLTDGYDVMPPESVAGGIPVLWLINNDDATPPWGKVARIEQQTEDAAV